MKNCECCIEYTSTKEYKQNANTYAEVRVNKKMKKKLKKRIANINKFSNHDINKFILLLRKDVSPFEYIDDWEIFNEASLPEKKDFYIHLNREGIK